MINSDSLRFAPLRIAPFRLAPDNIDLPRSFGKRAPSSCDPLKSVISMTDPEKSALFKLVLTNFASLIVASLIIDPFRFDPENLVSRIKANI